MLWRVKPRIPALLTTGEAARVIGVSSVAVRQYGRRGDLREIRTPSGLRLFLHDDVIAFKRRRDERRRAAAERIAG